MANVSGASIVEALIVALSPHPARQGDEPLGDPQWSAAVYAAGGREGEWLIGSREPRYLRDEVALQTRQKDRNSEDGVADAHRAITYLRDALLRYRGDRSVTVPEDLFLAPRMRPLTVRSVIPEVWITNRGGPRYRRRLEGGRAGYEIALTVQYRPVRTSPLTAPLAWAGSPFVVYEPGSDEPGIEISRAAVTPGTVRIGGRIESGPAGPLNNPADDAFREGAPQGAFAEAGPGEVLWRNTGVGVSGANLFDQTTTNEIPEAEGGGLVTLLRIEAGAGDVISFVTRQEFGKDLADNGLFIGRSGGVVYLFRLQGAPRNVGGDLYYDTTVAGLTTAAATAAAEWDWAFADGATWRAEPWVSEPPAGARWQLTLKVTNGAGVEFPALTRTLEYPGGPHEFGPVTITSDDGVLVQTLTIRDASARPITARSRYTVPVVETGMIVHGETAEAAVPLGEFDEAFAEDYG